MPRKKRGVCPRELMKEAGMNIILSAYFKLEANRFAPWKSDPERFRERVYEVGDEAVRKRFQGTSFEIPGFEEVIDPLDGYEIRTSFAFEAQPGGDVTHEVYDPALRMFLNDIAECKKQAASERKDPDRVPRAILLALHGAMVAEDHEDADGDFLEAVRNAVGPDCPIFVTLDLHVNLSKKMAKYADALFPCENYPHTDYRENGVKAAKILIDTLEGRVKPVMSVKSLPMLFPYTPTTGDTFREYYRKIREINALPGVLNFRFSHGFFASDVTEGGPAAIAVTDNDPALAERLANDFAAEIYEHRASFFRKFYQPEEALEKAKELLNSGVKAPIVLADVADNPGSGATGDSPVLLKAMIKDGIPSMYSAIFDPEAVKLAEEAGEGNEVELDLGGKVYPECTGGPVRVKAKVLQLSDGNYIQEGPYMHGALQKLGRSVLLGIGNVKVIVCSIRIQTSDRASFHMFGLSPETCPVVAVKSAVHFRASYEPVAGAVLEVETPALGPMDPRALTYTNVPKDFYPLNQG